MQKPSPNYERLAIKELLRHVIQLMEYFFNLSHDPTTVWRGIEGAPENLKSEINLLLALNDREDFQKRIRASFESAVVFRIPTTCYCRTFAPVTWLYMSVCAAAKLHPQDIFNSYITVSGFRRLGKVAKHFSQSPCHFLDVSDPEAFWLFLEDIAQNKESGVVFCDWPLDLEELQAIEAIVKHANMLFVWPAKRTF